MRGSAQYASVGYWIDEAYAGRGITTRAVAMAIDHCFVTVGLHRIEVAIRPENTSSLRVVEKLGIKEIGYAPRYLHIDGDWRDHKLFAITREEVPLGLLRRLDSAAAEAIHTNHTSDLTTHRTGSGRTLHTARIVVAVDLSAVIFVVLALAWAAYLIPKALKHHDEMASDRLVEGHSDKVRILSRKAKAGGGRGRRGDHSGPGAGHRGGRRTGSRARRPDLGAHAHPPARLPARPRSVVAASSGCSCSPSSSCGP